MLMCCVIEINAINLPFMELPVLHYSKVSMINNHAIYVALVTVIKSLRETAN